MLQVVGVLKVTREPMRPRVQTDPETGDVSWARGGFTGDGKLYYGSKAIEAVKAGDTSGLEDGLDFRSVTDFACFHFVGGASSDEVLDQVKRLRRGYVVWVLLEFDYQILRGATYKTDTADLVDLVVVEATEDQARGRVSLVGSMPAVRERAAVKG